MATLEYTVGKKMESWNEGSAQTVTFVVTEDCNLRCKYCYITHKSSGKKMNFTTAKKFIDMLLSDNFNRRDAVIIEFIGGEPLIEIDLIDQITDYFKIKSFEKNDDWFWNYRINICTNGMNYSSEKVQNYIKKNLNKMSLSITIDGIKSKHDMQRVTIDNQGSYDQIMDIVPLWLSQFLGATKVTFASQDLIYLKDSIISLWEKNITDVAANVVFENVWKQDDDKILEEQLKQLADYVIENKCYDKYYCTFFDDSIGYYYTEDDLNKTFCGAGKMIALGPNGNIYPCIRYKDYSLNNHKEWIIGSVDTEIDMEKIRPFILATTSFQSDQECLKCPIASGCAFCQGFNYDESVEGTNYSRAKYICKMHKARVRANDYYFSKLYNKYGIQKDELEDHEKRQLFILLSDDYVTYCEYENQKKNANISMSINDIKSALDFARKNYFSPIFVHSKNKKLEYMDFFEDHYIKHYIPIKMRMNNKFKNTTYIVENDDLSLMDGYSEGVDENLIFNINARFIKDLSKYVKILLNYTYHLEVNITNLSKEFDFQTYNQQLSEIIDEVIELNKITNIKKSVNLISDLGEKFKRNGCNAGEKSYIVSPLGDIYSCCALYSENLVEKSGTIFTEFEDNRQTLFWLDKSPLCKDCQFKQCKRCSYLNYLKTNEFNIPPSYQCRKSNIEYNASLNYLSHIDPDNNQHTVVDYIDPIEIWIKENKTIIGYYDYKK